MAYKIVVTGNLKTGAGGGRPYVAGWETNREAAERSRTWVESYLAKQGAVGAVVTVERETAKGQAK